MRVKRTLVPISAVSVLVVALGSCSGTPAERTHASVDAAEGGPVEEGRRYRFSWGLLELTGTVLETDDCWARVRGESDQDENFATGAPGWASQGEVLVNICSVQMVKDESSEDSSADVDSNRDRDRFQSSKDDQSLQAETVAEMRTLGAAMMEWLTDHAYEAEYADMGLAVRDNVLNSQRITGSVSWDSLYSPIGYSHLEKLLVPAYIQNLPRTDAWGTEYRFYLGNLKTSKVLCIRSAGSDQKWSPLYQIGSYDVADTFEDIVYTDGYFLRGPKEAT